MQKGTVCGADRSVYKLNIFFLDFFLCFCFVRLFNVSYVSKGLAGIFASNVSISY